ncbi:MAG: RsbRD N-terminal domain-containing protein [Deltaproteobacteria bacterium]
MALEDILRENRDRIVRKWFELILQSYPADGRNHFMKEANRFANPVGSSLREGVKGLFDVLAAGADLESEEVCAILDTMVRIRAVQEFSAAEAVEFTLLLKEIVRKTVRENVQEQWTVDELLTFEARIDRVTLLAFNIYMQCREKIYELRANELRNRTSRILQRACQVWEKRGECLPEELRNE